jgi:DNA ligase (NAD+)
MGDKTIQNMLDGIKQSCQIPYERVLFALGIRLVGETVAKTLAKNFNSIDQLSAASLEEMTAIHEIGDKIAAHVVDWFAEERNQKLLQKLAAAGVQLAGEYTAPELKGEQLSGKNFVVSGIFEKYEREALKTLIEAHGGKVQSGVNAKTHYVVAGANMGPSKLEKARSLQIPILNENEFEALLS